MPEAWRRYEYSLAETFNGERTKLSGAGHEKMDVHQSYFNIEAKSANKGAPRKFTVTPLIWDTASDHARRAGKRPLLAILLDGLSVTWMLYPDFKFVCSRANIEVPGPMIYMKEIKGTRILKNLVVNQSDYEEIEKYPNYVEFEMIPVLSFLEWDRKILVSMTEERLAELMKKGGLLL